jgi:hypothetical protein
LTGVSLHPPAPKGGPTRTSADVSVPRLAGFSLITLIYYPLVGSFSINHFRKKKGTKTFVF